MAEKLNEAGETWDDDYGLDPKRQPTNNPNETPLTVARKLREARRFLRLRQQTVADHMGMKRQSYAAIENNIRALQTLEMVRLCNLFRITPDELLGFSKESND